jgi:hypothetical protein
LSVRWGRRMRPKKVQGSRGFGFRLTIFQILSEAMYQLENNGILFFFLQFSVLRFQFSIFILSFFT